MLREIERRLTWVSAIVLTLFACLLLIVVGDDWVKERAQEDVLRAGAAAKAMARKVGLAADSGLTATHAQVAATASRGSQWQVLDATGKPLAGEPADGMPVREPITVQGVRVGQVVVFVPRWQSYGVLLPPALLLAVLVTLGVLVSREALRYAVRRGPLLRDLASASMVDRVAAQDLTMTVREGLRQPLDERASMLGGRVLELNEIYFRLRRLIESLIQTETEAEQRNRLERLLVDAHGGARFSNGTPKEIKLATVEVDIRWVFAMALAAFASLKTVLIASVDGAGLAVAGLVAMALGVIAAAKLSQTAMRGGTPTQFANAGMAAVLGATLACAFASGYQSDVAATTGNWLSTSGQVALRALDWLALAVASAGAVWLVQGGIHATQVARDEGSPAMPQSWAIGAVLGLELLGVVAGGAFLALAGRGGALVATFALAGVALLALVLSQWASNTWQGFHFVRDNDLSPPEWPRDGSVWMALAAGLSWGSLQTVTWVVGDTDSVSARLPPWFFALAGFGLGAYAASHTPPLPRNLWLAAVAGVCGALAFVLPGAVALTLPLHLQQALHVAAAAALGWSGWVLRLAAWARPADPNTRLSRLATADMAGVLIAATLTALSGVLGTRVFAQATWVVVIVALVAIFAVVGEKRAKPTRPAGEQHAA